MVLLSWKLSTLEVRSKVAVIVRIFYLIAESHDIVA